MMYFCWVRAHLGYLEIRLLTKKSTNREVDVKVPVGGRGKLDFKETCIEKMAS